MKLYLILFFILAGITARGNHQSTCEYWLQHFDRLTEAKRELDNLRAANAHPFRIWLAKRKLKKVFIAEREIAFGELVDESERLFPDDPPDPESDNYFQGNRRW